MISRERVEMTLSHRQPDRVPLDLGASLVTGMHVSSVYQLRQSLGLDEPGTPVKVVEPMQMLGEIGPDLVDTLGIDVVGLGLPTTKFGFKNEGWKPWRTFDGTPVLVPDGFNTDPEPNGDLLMYPQGDPSAPPSGRMPKDGWYFDAIVRQNPIDEESLRVEDNTEEFVPIAASALEYLRLEAERLYTETDKAIVGSFGDTGFGDIAAVPAVHLRHPRGIRDIEEWYVSTIARKDYVKAIFRRQCAVGVANLAEIHRVVGDRLTAILITGTDFGMQTGPFVSPAVYRELYQPFHAEVNNWVHTQTKWKTMIHSCGSVRAFLDDFIDAGFDILNPVQCSAADMEPVKLKQEYGHRIVFWGGGIDTQKTLPFGTPAQVRREVAERIGVFGADGGFVFSAVHNIQARTPVENLRALYTAFDQSSAY